MHTISVNSANACYPLILHERLSTDAPPELTASAISPCSPSPRLRSFVPPAVPAIQYNTRNTHDTVVWCSVVYSRGAYAPTTTREVFG
jgi:hypothetical protein